MVERTDVTTVGVGGVGSLGVRLGGAFAELPNATLSALADVDSQRLASVGEQLDVPDSSLYRKYESMLQDESLDAVGIATPNGLHYEQAMAALDRDLHVLCEKPLATSARDAYELMTRARQCEENVMVGYQRHLNPAYEVARERWALGENEPRFITGEITQDWRSYYKTLDNWRMDPELSGGGHLLNVGTHVIDAILWTTGLTPTHVRASMDFHDEEGLFDKQSSITIEFDNGAVASVADTGLVACTREHIHIWDEEGAVYLDGKGWGERTGYTIDSDGSEHEGDFEYSRRLSKATAFLEAIEDGVEPPATVEDGFLATLVTMAAYESARRDVRVSLTEQYPFAADVLQ